MTNIAVIGGGQIGEALVSGLVAANVNPLHIRVTNRTEARGQELHDRYGIVNMTDNAQAADEADVVFLCVKPKFIIEVLSEITPTLDNNSTHSVVVSMAAGISIAAMEESATAGLPVIRVMPNTPMLVGKGMSTVTPGRHINEDQLNKVKELLSTVGDVLEVAEYELDAVTAMSGSSPAYLFLVTEALIDAGVNLGLPRGTAKQLAVAAFEGAATMMKETGKEPSELRAGVSSPAGTTIAAIRELEESGIRGAFYRAAQACADRSEELGKQ
ncbi:Pyrroline-5-carboxylate reductase [Corynebacterium deserti GIMN1.010]|uniref:Pyrroline-5-carboxylate reductase n=1 Tax=Corynebacterium deserti GIMN1.010 TaxID=931089 RepID=A0A0M4CHU3_9CORY|nr:pyrroline-5-carboxylate reductase [Corynebacterium deserti]ALC04914.1 Pyrroline-5-carboxylate reductase [Corynebacterium deserti GIMN1.010]